MQGFLHQCEQVQCKKDYYSSCAKNLVSPQIYVRFCHSIWKIGSPVGLVLQTDLGFVTTESDFGATKWYQMLIFTKN